MKAKKPYQRPEVVEVKLAVQEVSLLYTCQCDYEGPQHVGPEATCTCGGPSQGACYQNF